MRRSRRKLNVKKLAVILIGFIVLFTVGFMAGSKFFGKPSNTATSEKTTNSAKTLQGSKENVDKSQQQKQSSNETDKNKFDNKNDVTTNKDSKDGTNKTSNSQDPIPQNKKEAYLTFDDGPTKKITPRILKTLDDYNVKATFFILGQNAERLPQLVKEERAKGHAIANHTYCHDYKYLYSNTSNFLKDLKKCENVLASILGEYNGKVIRFPGGSFGKKKTPFKQAANKAGYTYVDWNALNGDAEHHNVPADKLIERIKNTTKNQNHVVILMHDAATKATTAEALPKIIEYLKSQGYEFKTLDEEGNIPSNLPSVHSPKVQTKAQ